MTRGVPIIKRVRETRYQASDGRSFVSHADAFRHETFLQLAAFLRLRLQHHKDDPEELARSLLAAPDFRVVLLGPQTPVRKVQQGPASQKEGTS